MTAAASALVATTGLLVGTTAVVGMLESLTAAATGDQPSAEALAEIPSDLLPVYKSAAARCEGLPWHILAAIGWVESRHANRRSDPSTGDVRPPIFGPVLDGRPGLAAIRHPSSPDGWARALGPMQFLPATWSRWAILAPNRPPGTIPDPHNAWDAIHSAARKLCADRPLLLDLRSAVLAYNRSEAYLDRVVAKAFAYGMSVGDSGAGSASRHPAAPPGGGPTHHGDPAVVVRAALSQLGVPYVWGGAQAGRALDCSGLVVVAYAAAGIALPRTTAEQVAIGVPVEVAALQPGDLLFFRGGRPTRDLGHVAIYAGEGLMVIAPRTGEVVSLRPVPHRSVQMARRVIDRT